METLEEKIAYYNELRDEVKALDKQIRELRELRNKTNERWLMMGSDVCEAQYHYPVGTKVRVRYNQKLYGKDDNHVDVVFVDKPVFSIYKNDFEISFKECKKDGTMSKRKAYVPVAYISSIERVED